MSQICKIPNGCMCTLTLKQMHVECVFLQCECVFHMKKFLYSDWLSEMQCHKKEYAASVKTRDILFKFSILTFETN